MPFLTVDAIFGNQACQNGRCYFLSSLGRNGDGTYGDHQTLQATADLYNVEFIVISSLGPAATTVISPVDSLPICSFYIGHYTEGDGEHYVRLQNDPLWQDTHR